MHLHFNVNKNWLVILVLFRGNKVMTNVTRVLINLLYRLVVLPLKFLTGASTALPSFNVNTATSFALPETIMHDAMLLFIIP